MTHALSNTQENTAFFDLPLVPENHNLLKFSLCTCSNSDKIPEAETPKHRVRIDESPLKICEFSFLCW